MISFWKQHAWPRYFMNDAYNLHRFLDAQERVYDTVLEELRAGRKASHWIWFIFPQIAGLGHSGMAKQFAIAHSTRLACIIHDGSSRNRQDARRDGRAERREAEAYLKQYVEVTAGVRLYTLGG
jgi:hypothetical protein